MYEGLARAGYSLVGWGWSLWDFNWYRRPDPAGLADRLARRISAGDIVVMHDGHHEDPEADRQYAVDATAPADSEAARPGVRARDHLLEAPSF